MPRGRTREMFRRVKRFVVLVGGHPELAEIKLDERCEQAGIEHVQSPRQFMHVGCENNTICAWGKAADDLPEEFLVGLFLHEYGHCVVGDDEKGADLWAFEALGIPIQYRDHESIKDLEWVDPLIIAERQI